MCSRRRTYLFIPGRASELLSRLGRADVLQSKITDRKYLMVIVVLAAINTLARMWSGTLLVILSQQPRL